MNAREIPGHFSARPAQLVSPPHRGERHARDLTSTDPKARCVELYPDIRAKVFANRTLPRPDISEDMTLIKRVTL
jgi:hypothetical protein